LLLKSNIMMGLVSYSKLPILSNVFQQKHHFSVSYDKNNLFE